jgi:ribose transport system substrate-binding protein
MLQSDRPIVPMSLQGEAGAACYWRHHPEIADTAFYIWPPGGEIYFGWNVALRVLEGQGPKVQSIVRKVMKYSLEDNNAQVPEDCKIDDQTWLEPKGEDWFPASLADQVFLRPSDPLTWKPNK